MFPVAALLLSTFVYDRLDKLSSQTVAGLTTEYVLDVAGGLPEVIVATTGGAGISYVQIQGQVLAQHEAGAWSYALPDHLGSLRQLADAAGQVALAQSYDPFGNLFESSGSGASDFGYTGEAWDSDAELLFLRARHYDPRVGRFLSKDPFSGFTHAPQTLHAFAYVLNNPANRVDPSGYQGEPAGQAVQLCLRSAPTCASLLAAGATILVDLGPLVLIAVPIVYIITHPLPVPDQVIQPQPAPEPQRAPAPPLPDVTPYPPDTTGTEDWRRLPVIYQRPLDHPEDESDPSPGPTFPPFPVPARPPTCTPTPEPVVRVRHYRTTIDRVMNTSPMILKPGQSGPAIWVEHPIITPYEEKAIQQTSKSFMRPLNGRGGFVEFNVDLNKWEMEQDPNLPHLPNSKMIWLRTKQGVLYLEGFPLYEPGVDPEFFDWQGNRIK